MSLRTRMIRVKAAFGLSSVELAAVIRCSRCALYRYLDELTSSDIPEVVLQRLRRAEAIAQRWLSMDAGTPGRHLHAALVPESALNGNSLYSLLCSDEVDDRDIGFAVELVAGLSREDLKEAARTNRLLACGFGMTESV